MNKGELERRLQALLRDIIEDDVSFGVEDNLFQFGVLDSVLLIRLVDEIERAFSISVADREMVPDYFLSIDRMSLYVLGKLAQSGVAPAQGS